MCSDLDVYSASSLRAVRMTPSEQMTGQLSKGSEGARVADSTTRKRRSGGQITAESVGEGPDSHIRLFERHLKAANRSA